MAVYLAKKNIKLLSTGNDWMEGQQIGESQIPRPILSQLIAEGALVEVKEAEQPKPPRKAPKKE